jgi:hypothetical protein
MISIGVSDLIPVNSNINQINIITW